MPNQTFTAQELREQAEIEATRSYSRRAAMLRYAASMLERLDGMETLQSQINEACGMSLPVRVHSVLRQVECYLYAPVSPAGKGEDAS